MAGIRRADDGPIVEQTRAHPVRRLAISPVGIVEAMPGSPEDVKGKSAP